MCRGLPVRPVTALLESARSHYNTDSDLHRIVLNATSWVEANLAVELLAGTVPERVLVTYTNIREAIKELPRCPMLMAIDFEGLAKAWSLERVGTAWSRSFPDEQGGHSVLLLGEGNHCYDVVVRVDGRTIMLMPPESADDYLNPEVVDVLMERPSMLGNVIDLLQAMGMGFYPSFYLSLEDWRQEYAATMFEECSQIFSREGADDPLRHAPAKEPARDVAIRYRGTSNDGGIAWLF
ncbi:MAG: hypothetical protein ACYC6J_05205 [Coriobacteriia bacterium]